MCALLKSLAPNVRELSAHELSGARNSTVISGSESSASPTVAWAMINPSLVILVGDAPLQISEARTG